MKDPSYWADVEIDIILSVGIEDMPLKVDSGAFFTIPIHNRQPATNIYAFVCRLFDNPVIFTTHHAFASDYRPKPDWHSRTGNCDNRAGPGKSRCPPKPDTRSRP